MKKFADKKTVRVYFENMVHEEDETDEITVTVTNDCREIADPEDGVKVSWFSVAKCREAAEYFDEYPADEEIACAVAKCERAENAEVVD